MQRSQMRVLATTATAALLALPLALAARPAQAQEVEVALNNVTFDDGAVAAGFFDLDFSTDQVGSFFLVTTNGATDAQTGFVYTPTTATAIGLGTNSYFFSAASQSSELSLVFDTPFTATPGSTYQLTPGTVASVNELAGSGEFTPTNARAITGGEGIVTLLPAAAPAPEAGTSASLGLMLAAGAGALAVGARKRRAAR